MRPALLLAYAAPLFPALATAQQVAWEAAPGEAAPASLRLESGWDGRLGEDGLELTGSRDAWRLSLWLAEWGRTGELEPVAEADRRSIGPRVEYLRGTVTEWYVRDAARGIEQGFTLAAPPPHAVGSGWLELVLGVEGGPLPELDMTPRGARNARFVDAWGEVVATYTDLLAWDASGCELPATLAVVGDRLSILVDDEGAAYPVTIDPWIGTPLDKVTSQAPAPDDSFGRSVAISGDLVAVGAPYTYAPPGATGDLHVFRRGNLDNWASEVWAGGYRGPNVKEQFGASVAISGETVVVGAPGYDAPATDTGFAEVWRFLSGAWIIEGFLQGSGIGANHEFGGAVAIEGSTIVVGCKGTNAVYVFIRSGSTWTEQAKLTTPWPADLVDISGETIVLASTNDLDVAVFTRSGTTWTLQTFPPSPSAFEMRAVAIDGDTIVTSDVGSAFGLASAHVYTRAGSAWSLETSLHGSGGEVLDVDVQGDVLVLGLPFLNVPGPGVVGGARVYSRRGSTWFEDSTLTPSGLVNGGSGTSVALDSDHVVLGGVPGTGSGFAHIARVARASCTQHFEDLTLGIPIDNQGGWQVVGTGPAAVLVSSWTQGPGKVVSFGSLAFPGPNGESDASRMNDGAWSLPALDGSETSAFFELDYAVAVPLAPLSRFRVGLVYDKNNSGHSRLADTQEVGPYLELTGTGSVRLVSPAGASSTSSLLGNAGRLRLVMDLTANGGSGLGSVYWSAGGDFSPTPAPFVPLAGLQGLDLGLDRTANSAANPLRWEGLLMNIDEPNAPSFYGVDNLRFQRSLEAYDCECLPARDTAPFEPLNGMDGWVTRSINTSVDAGVTTSESFDGSRSIEFDASGPPVEVEAGRLWEYPVFTGSETTAYIQADMRLSYWGNTLAPATDVNADGDTFDAGERGLFLLAVGNMDMLALADADGGLTSSSLSASCGSGGWIRVRLVMDLAANGGSGLGYVYCKDPSAGSAPFTPVPGLQAVDLQLDPLATDAKNPANWQGINFRINGADGSFPNGAIDNLEFGTTLPTQSEPYCTAGTSANGCQAQLSTVGVASASAASGFSVLASSVEDSKDGLYFYGTNGRQANPWGNGTSYQCVLPPVKRAGLLTGSFMSGVSGACTGYFIQDMNTLWSTKPAKNPGSGAVVQAQLWYRDPFNTSNQTTSLSNAIEFVVGP